MSKKHIERQLVYPSRKSTNLQQKYVAEKVFDMLKEWRNPETLLLLVPLNSQMSKGTLPLWVLVLLHFQLRSRFLVLQQYRPSRDLHLFVL